ALNSGHGNPSLEQAFNALCMRLATPQCSDIEGIGGKGVDQRRIVDLRVVGERDQRGAGIDADLGKRLVRPFTRDLGSGETRLRREGSPRVYDHHVVAESSRHWNELLRYMHGADDDEAHRGIEDIDENLAGICGKSDALVAAKRISKSGR